MNRRDFTRLVAGGSAALIVETTLKGRSTGDRATDARSSIDARLRDAFRLAPGLTFMNAANLCPPCTAASEALHRWSVDLDRDPSSATKARLAQAKEETRGRLAEMLRVSAEEIVITRNTSEANNLVSSGLSLSSQDEVVILADNHPSNHAAWREKGSRSGFSVKIVAAPAPHPGPDYFVDAFAKATTARTRVWAFTHATNTAGDLLPVKDLCRAAAERGILTLVDGAQSFGVLDVDLSQMQPDFFTGSGHKWPCGPKEVGLLYVNRRSAGRLSPAIISVYAGAAGASKTLEGFGQRDEPAVAAFGAAVAFRNQIGGAAIEHRVRGLVQALAQGARKIDGVRIWTDTTPERSAGVLTFQPGSLDPRALASALYEKDRIACATRGGTDRPGLRFSPHVYNTHEEVEKVVAAIGRYVKQGL
jgi:isopenicillin-N epimerase